MVRICHWRYDNWAKEISMPCGPMPDLNLASRHLFKSLIWSLDYSEILLVWLTFSVFFLLVSWLVVWVLWYIIYMVLYIVEECGMPCFSLAVYWRTDVYKNGRSPALLLNFFFFCFGRGTSVARRDQGGGLAPPESCRGFCQSRYDTK